jgi:anthranilate synthase
VDHYDFSAVKHHDGSHISTAGQPVEFAPDEPFKPAPAGQSPPPRCDHAKGEYARLVEEYARDNFLCGNFFEVVPGQTFFERCRDSPSAIFNRLREANPSPYSFFINLGQKTKTWNTSAGIKNKFKN